MTVSLNIDNQSIRLVSRKAGRIEIWETLELPAATVKDGLILNPEALANILKEQFRTLKLDTHHVKVCLNGLSFIYRVLTLPLLKPEKIRTAVERATQKEISMPLENLYLDWQIVHQNSQEMKIFVLGIARPMVDVLLETAGLAGLTIRTLELKALSLAKASNQMNALVVDCEPESFEIVIVHSGIPVTIHRVSPKNEMATLEDNVNQLINELNRAIDFHNLNHHDQPLTQATPVMLCGSLCDSEHSRDLIVGHINHTVENFVSPLAAPLNFPVSTFAANLGLLKPERAGDTRTESVINLIKAKRQSSNRPGGVRQYLTAGVVCAALILFAVVWFARQQAVQQTNALSLTAENLDRELLSARESLAVAGNIQSKILELNTAARSLETERKEMTGEGDIAAIIRAIVRDLPAGMTFSRISSQPDRVYVEGQASAREDIVSYVQRLESEKLFTEVRIALIHSNGEKSADLVFRIVAER